MFMGLIALLIGYLQVWAQAPQTEGGIKFFEGTFEQALAQAKQEGKLLFVDFYAQWCGPCKKMSRTVFPQPSVGEYFNKHFISLKLDAEKPENVATAKKYKVDGFPTLGFIAADGQAISINVGYMSAEELIKAAKTATGDVLSFDKLYEMYRKDKTNLQLQQDLLQQAPMFLAAQEGIEAEKWAVRLRKLYQSYIQTKMGSALINKTDYQIITSLGGDDDEVTESLIDFINKNLNQWIEAIGTPAAYYIIEKNDAKMETLAKEGKLRYQELLEKINGEYRDAYSVIPFDKVSPYDKSKKYYDALYLIYKDKDVKQYIELMNQYFALLGAKDVTAADYGKAAQELYYAASSRLTKPDHEQAIAWLTLALKGDSDVMGRINFLAMMGDSYRELTQYDRAQECYNQAYLESLQLEQMEMAQAMLQARLKMKISELELLRK